MISVIIPVYNVDKYITECLKSFEKQVYKNFELIIVDDGSTDRSVTMINNYAKNSNLDIKLISQKNLGVSVARNSGLKNAKGDYICFVDADDMVGPEYLDQMVKILKTKNCELAICGSKSVPEDFDISEYTYQQLPWKIINSDEALTKFLYNQIKTGIWSLMVKSDLIRNKKLRFAEGYSYSEDLEMIWKMMLHSKKIAHSKTQLYIYRIRKGSAMSFINNKRMDGFKLMKGLENYFDRMRPDFFKKFKKHGTARWVWATLWQIAVASDNYKSFMAETNKYNAKKYMEKLISYPKFHIAFSAFLYCLNPFFYYLIAKKVGSKRLSSRELYTRM